MCNIHLEKQFLHLLLLFHTSNILETHICYSPILSWKYLPRTTETWTPDYRIWRKTTTDDHNELGIFPNSINKIHDMSPLYRHNEIDALQHCRRLMPSYFTMCHTMRWQWSNHVLSNYSQHNNICDTIVTCHMLPVTCHLSPAFFHLSTVPNCP